MTNIRQQLIELETAQNLDKEVLANTTVILQEALKEQAAKDKAIQARRHEIQRLRKEIEREERIAESIEQAEEVRLKKEKFEALFHERGDGHVWYEGMLPHQWQGMMFGAVAKRWVLGDSPGLGKTWQSIGWLDLIQAKRVVVVVPAEICDQWAGEAMDLAPHRTITNLYKKTPKRRHELLDEARSKNEGLIVVNYEIWRRDKEVLAKLIMWQPDTVIVDEAHGIKSTATSNFKTIKALVMADNTCPRCGTAMRGLYEPQKHALSTKVARACPQCEWTIKQPIPTRFNNQLEQELATKSTKNLLLATGTPILNSPEDIYPLLHLCDPILFKNANQFLSTYCRENFHSGKWEFRPGGLENLKPLIAGRFLARNPEDAGVQIPKQHVHFVSVDLDKNEYPKQYRVIRQLSEAASILLDSGARMTVMHLIALIMRKRQANVWPGGIEIRDEDGNVVFSVGDEVHESVKMDYILDNIQQFHTEGHRQVVFSQFKTALAELEKRLLDKGIRAVRLDGDTPPALRAEIKTNFYRAKGEAPKWDVLLANYKTGGVGLNLTSITKTHILDEEWNPGKRDQAYGRSARMGQTQETDVLVYRISGTIDTWMANTLHRKEKLVGEFTETMVEDREDMTMSLREAMESGEIL